MLGVADVGGAWGAGSSGYFCLAEGQERAEARTTYEGRVWGLSAEGTEGGRVEAGIQGCLHLNGARAAP